jgi:hypothetical protein
MLSCERAYPAPSFVNRMSMIPKSGHRLSGEIMLKQEARAQSRSDRGP